MASESQEADRLTILAPRGVAEWQSSLRRRRELYRASHPSEEWASGEEPNCPGCCGTGWRMGETGSAERCGLCTPPKLARSLAEYVIPPTWPAQARRQMDDAKTMLQMVIDSGGPPWVVLHGPNGTGKTFLATILIAARQRVGDSGQMWRAEELLQWLQETQGDLDHLPKEERETLSSRSGFIRGLRWLVLDELGKERKSTWGLEQMEALINRRYQDAKGGNGGGLIVTTNFDPLALGSPFSDAVRSRFGDRSLCEIVNLAHVPDFRPRLRPEGERL